MNIPERHSRVLRPLREHRAEIQHLNIDVAYSDVLHTSTVLEILKAELLTHDLANVQPAAVCAVQVLWDLMGMQLKALYMFADVLLDVLFREVGVSSKARRMTTKEKFLQECPGWLKPLHVLPVYAIQVYRHKFIIHLEKPRVHVYAQHPDGSLWLTPSNFKVSAEDAEQVVALGTRYDRQIPGVASVSNMREQVGQLFHGIPPWSRDGLGWRWNPDRTQIDGIADRVGCKSMTYDQILRVLDTFVLAIAEAFVQQASAEGQTDRLDRRPGAGVPRPRDADAGGRGRTD